MADTMRALFVTYPRVGLTRGGLQIQIEESAAALRRRGIDVVLYDPWLDAIGDVDVCHIFSLDGSLAAFAVEAARRGTPVVVSPVFNRFHEPDWMARLKVGLSRRVPGTYTDLVRAEIILRNAARVVCLNERERRLVTTAFRMSPDRFTIVPNGVATRFGDVGPDAFHDAFGVRDFVLNVGTFRPEKNQITLIEAMSGGPIPLVLVGSPSAATESYYQRCRSVAGPNVVFCGHIDHEDPLLASAFAAARIFALPSTSEVMPLVLFEAARAGCTLLVSEKVPIEPLVPGAMVVLPPNSVGAWQAAVTAHAGRPRGEMLGDGRYAAGTWDDVAELIERVYREVTASS